MLAFALVLSMEHLEFNQQIWLTLIVGGLTIFASLVTGSITFLTAARLREAERYKRDLLRAYGDIAAFHRLEQCYAQELARNSGASTPESWRREIRKKLREEGFSTPSDKSTAHRADMEAAELAPG